MRSRSCPDRHCELFALYNNGMSIVRLATYQVIKPCTSCCCDDVGFLKVVLHWTDDVDDDQHAISADALNRLEKMTDARGRRLKVRSTTAEQHMIEAFDVRVASRLFAPIRLLWNYDTM